MNFFKRRTQLPITRDQLFNFIKNDQEIIEQPSSTTMHYMQSYDRYQNGQSIIGWNWSAYFFSIFWYAYHRMFGAFFSFLMVFFVSKSLIVACIYAGALANYHYVFFVSKQIAKGQIHHETSWILPIILLILVGYIVYLEFVAGALNFFSPQFMELRNLFYHK